MPGLVRCKGQELEPGRRGWHWQFSCGHPDSLAVTATNVNRHPRTNRKTRRRSDTQPDRAASPLRNTPPCHVSEGEDLLPLIRL